MLGVLVTEGATAESIYYAHLALGSYILLRLGYYACHHVARYLQQTASFTAKMNVLESLFGTILNFPLSWQVQQHSGEKISRLYRGSGAVDATIGTYIWQFIEGFTKLIFATTAIFLLDFWIAITVVAMGFVTILLIVFFNKRLVSAIRRSNHFFDRLNRILVDYMSHIITVKSFSLEEQGRKYIEDKKLEGYRLNRRIVRYGEMKWASVGIGYTALPEIEGITERTQRTVLKDLVGLGVIKETPGFKRNKIYRFSPYLDLFEQLKDSTSEEDLTFHKGGAYGK